MRAASTAAFFALSTPTHATGTPGGIWAIESRASRPARDRLRGRQRDADDRQLGVGGDHARQRGGEAGAGDDHAQAAHLRVLGVVGDRVGVAVGGHDADLVADAARVELLRRRLHRRHVALGAHDDADARGVDLHALELGLDLGLGRRAAGCRSCAGSVQRDVPTQLAPVEVDHVGGSIRGVPGGTDVRAEGGDVEDPAAGRDDLAARLGGARVQSPRRPRGTRSSPRMTSPEDEDSG